MRTQFLACAAVTLMCSAPLQAQPFVAPPENVLQLSASATVEVSQDLLRMQLSTTREGTSAQQVQAELKAALDQALTQARAAALPGQMDVRTGDFRLLPRYGRDGRMTGWQGTAELVLEGRDFPRIAQAAGRIPSLTLAGVSFDLSREQRERIEREAQAQAVANFRARAGELAKQFGFGSFGLREVAVNAGESGPPPRPMRALSMEAKAADAPVPVEAGKTAVSVTVSGSVQLR